MNAKNEKQSPKRAAGGSLHENHLDRDLRALGLVFEREHVFAATLGRRWRFDFAFLNSKVAVEVDGGIFTGGRHARGTGIVADCEKYNSALVLGWRVLRVAPVHVNNGQAVQWVLCLVGKEETRPCR